MTVRQSLLAIHGGPKTIDHDLAPYQAHGAEEVAAGLRVLESGMLSGFVAGELDGGPMVQEFEHEWARTFHFPYAVAMNSATSGLIAALSAVQTRPGDEVIVSPWTMSATAAAVLAWGAKPIFCDIEAETFGLDPESLKRMISARTRAVIVSDIFGHAARVDDLIDVAEGIPVIEDAAQSPYAMTTGARFAGTVGNIGVFSLNRHKHIHTGEGGVCVTADPRLDERLRLIRNHGESIGNTKSRWGSNSDLWGYNFRLGEIEAAIGTEQLNKLPMLADGRTIVGSRLKFELAPLDGVFVPVTRQDCSHVFYMFALKANPKLISRDKVLKALRAEGVPANAGYQLIHHLPAFRSSQVCPVAEYFQETVITLETCAYEFAPEDTQLTGEAFRKVWDNLDRI